MEPIQKSNVTLVPHPDTLRNELAEVKEEIRRLMRQSSKEVDVSRQADLQVQIASQNRRAAKLMDQLGLAGVFKEDKVKEARRSSSRPRT